MAKKKPAKKKMWLICFTKANLAFFVLLRIIINKNLKS